jgi:hypothetical protein
MNTFRKVQYSTVQSEEPGPFGTIPEVVYAALVLGSEKE